MPINYRHNPLINPIVIGFINISTYVYPKPQNSAHFLFQTSPFPQRAVERRESELWSVAVCPARSAMSVTFQRGSVGRPSGAGKPVANPLGFPEDAGILPCFTNQNGGFTWNYMRFPGKMRFPDKFHVDFMEFSYFVKCYSWISCLLVNVVNPVHISRHQLYCCVQYARFLFGI